MPLGMSPGKSSTQGEARFSRAILFAEHSPSTARVYTSGPRREIPFPPMKNVTAGEARRRSPRLLLISLRSVSEAIRRRKRDLSGESVCAESLLILGLEGSRYDSSTLWVFKVAGCPVAAGKRRESADFAAAVNKDVWGSEIEGE
jgi:hypothetical protein